MAANTKIYSGGDVTISAFFNQQDSRTSSDTDINRLISECSTSKESLSRLYIMFKSSVFAIGFTITSDYHLAEDCVTETFVRLAQTKRFNPEKGNGKGFILTIARNVALELRRSYKIEKADFYLQSYGETDTAVENSIYINQLLQHLNDKQRQIVVMKCCAELTFREIAKIMKSPESTVKSRYNKAMTILKEKAGDDK